MAWLVLCLSLLLPNVLRAAEQAQSAVSGTVVIVFESDVAAVSRRLRQEIEALGFSVQMRTEEGAGGSLEELARAASALAAIRVQPLEAGGVEMTVLDRATGKTVHRELARVTSTDPASQELVATRTVELFRASLLELSADHPSRGEVRATKPVEALVQHDDAARVRRDSGALGLASGCALLLMPKWNPSAQFWVEASWVSQWGLGLSAAVFSPISATHLSAAEGSVDLLAATYRLGVLWDSDADERLFSGRLAAGLSLSTLNLHGNANPSFVAQRQTSIAWAPWLSVAGRLRVSSHFAIYAEAALGFALPRETIRFAGSRVGDFARPLGLAAIGPELSWP